MKENKKYDKSDGSTKEVDLNIDEMISSLRAIDVNTKGKRDDLAKPCKNNNLPLKKK